MMKAYWLVPKYSQGRLDFLRQGSILVIHDDDAVFSDGSANVAACAFQHIDVAGHFRDLHLDFAEILVLALS